MDDKDTPQSVIDKIAAKDACNHLELEVARMIGLQKLTEVYHFELSEAIGMLRIVDKMHLSKN